MKLLRTLKRFSSNAEGIASLEFVLILFPLMFVFFGMVMFGTMLYHYNQMQNVARETVRFLAVDDDVVPAANGADVTCPGTAGTAEGIACQMLGIPGDVDGSTVSACFRQEVVPAPGRARFNAIVTITAPMDKVGMLDVFGLGVGRTLTVTADMRVEPGKIHIDNPPIPTLCGGGAPVLP